MKKLLIILALSLSWVSHAHAQLSTAEPVVLGTNTLSAPYWTAIGTQAPLPVSINCAAASATNSVLTCTTPGSQATFQPSSGGSGTVSLGSTGQIAAYLANGTTISPTNNIDLNNGGVTIGTGAVGNAPGLNGLYVQGFTSIGAPAHASLFNVSGGVSIGTDYVISTAPTNGAIIEGNVDIGTATASASNKLAVYGAASIGTSYVNIAAPTNGAVIQGNVGIGTTTSISTPLTIVSGTTGTASVPATALFTSYENTSANLIFSALAPNTGGGDAAYFTVGKDTSTNDAAQYAFWYQGASSTTNYLQLSLSGNGFGLNVTGAAVGVGVTSINASDVFAVNGAAAIGSYASIAAPSNGLIVSGNVGLGTSAIVSGSGTTISGHIGYAPTNVPVVTSCGGGTLTAGSTDNKGTITGISAASSCTITFSSALPAGPSCAFSTNTGVASGGIPTTAAVTAAMALFTGTLGYICQ